MRKKVKETIIVFIVSVVLAGVAVLLCFLDGEPNQDKIASFILLPIWFFSILPAYLLTYYWLKSKSFIEGCRIGSGFGVVLGFAAFLLPIIIGPFLMIYYYLDFFMK